MEYMVVPLRKQKVVQYRFISWKTEKIKKEDDDDEYVFGTDPFFKLLALVLSDMKLSQTTWKNVI